MTAFRRTREEAPDSAFGIAFDKTKGLYVWLLKSTYHHVQFVQYHMKKKLIGSITAEPTPSFIKNFKLIEKWK